MYFVCLLREMCSQRNYWTRMCKESYQEGEKWKKRQFQVFGKYIKWSCTMYLGINCGMNRSLVLFDTQLHFLQLGKQRREKEVT